MTLVGEIALGLALAKHVPQSHAASRQAPTDRSNFGDRPHSRWASDVE